VDIEALDTLERAKHRRQKQLCVPLVAASTYWYPEAAPELLAIVGKRLEDVLGELP